MCGIAGIVSVDGRSTPSQDAVRRMLDAIAHRGPDDSGIVAQSSVVLGHRRLSIQDLSAAAHQPMRHPEGLLTYNGEIYNHREVRDALPSGIPFQSSGDTETLLHALATWGEAALPRLNGMFGFGWWDKKKRSLTLVRDRMGVKPVYYATVGNWFLFCSELKGILASGLIDYEPEPQAVSDYLGLRFVPAPLTAAKGIFKLPPGHLLVLAKGKVSVRQWWRLPVAAMEEPIHADTQERFEALLQDAVRLRMIADVPVGIFLSGGLDSSAVAALVAQDRPLKSFSVAFEGGGFYDERFYARLVAKRLKTEHTEITVNAKQFRDSLSQVVGMLDEPVMDLAALPLYFLSKSAREQVKVVLSGEGSDEVLGGYNFNRIAFQFACLNGFQKIPKGLRDAVRTVSVGRVRDMITQFSWPTDRYPALKGLHITNIFSDAERSALLTLPQGLASSRRYIDGAYAQVAHADPINQMLAVYSGGWLSEDLLMKADKMTMAHGLELRVPFLDYRLVEFLFGLPGHAKVRGPRTTGTKMMLRRATRGKLPRAVLTRDKRGFPVPLAEWVRSDPRWFEELLANRDGIGAMFRREGLTDLMRRSRAGEHVWQRVWNLAGLWMWDEQMRGISRGGRIQKSHEAA